MKKRLIAVPLDQGTYDLQSVYTGSDPLLPPKPQPKPPPTPMSNNWWKQQKGVARVRNGFVVQGLIAIPVPKLTTRARSLPQTVTNKGEVK
ncbi:MAG TPA: hypothetical protein VEL49_03835 [Ktedonobacteraceae bacterium]|nr:hypothetical protein [Ktedonobacteraceae bacterium]